MDARRRLRNHLTVVFTALLSLHAVISAATAAALTLPQDLLLAALGAGKGRLKGR